jgi:hypothetical protein
MNSRHNQLWSAVLTDAVKPEVCLECNRAAMFAPHFTQIDQTTRNGP